VRYSTPRGWPGDWHRSIQTSRVAARPATQSQPLPYTCDLRQRVNLGLGVTFEAGFNASGAEPSRLQIIGAEAIGLSSVA
jgi:hypothetical protein